MRANFFFYQQIKYTFSNHLVSKKRSPKNLRISRLNAMLKTNNPCRLLRPYNIFARKLSTSQPCAANEMGKLDNKVAVVTASTEGIGFAIAKKLAIDGASVVISSRKQSNVDRALDELKSLNLKVTGTVCHVGKKEHRLALIKKAVDDFGGIDILVSNAAVNPVMGTLLSTPEDAFDKIMEINVKAAFMLVKETVPEIEKRGKGSIILNSSIGGLAPFELLGAYSVSKTAILGLTKAMTNELGRKNIRVNCLAPGVIKTKFSSALWQNSAAEEQINQNCALNRIGTPDECAGIVSFLASDEASYVTGETFVVSGGMQSRL